MIHMVFMKFEEGFFCDEVYEKIEAAFHQLQDALPKQVLSVELHRNCVDRSHNMDLLIRMELVDEDALDCYLRHPIHTRIGEAMNSHIINRCSFDYCK